MIDPALALGLLLMEVFFFVLRILVTLNLQRTLERVSHEKRAMTPGMVWLQIIPVFGFFWFFHVIVKVRDSVRAEYLLRGWSTTGDFGLNIGIAAGVLQIVAYGAAWGSERLVVMAVVLYLGALVCWIIYWMRTATYKIRLGSPSWAPGAYYAGAPYGPPSPGAPGPPASADMPQDDGDPGDEDGGSDAGDEGPAESGPAESGPGGDTLLCPACAATVKKHDRFCYVCGSRLPWNR